MDDLVICRSMPPALAVPAGYTPLFRSRADGVPIYTCQSGKWAFHAARAELFDPEYDQHTVTHYVGASQDGERREVPYTPD